MAQELSKAQAVGTLPAVSPAVDAIFEALCVLTHEVNVCEARVVRLAGSPPEAGGMASPRDPRPYEDGQMAGVEDQLLVLLRTLRYVNERLSTVTQ